MRVSILLPTRKRFSSLKASLDSLRRTCDFSELEILLAVDEDDDETLASLEAEPIEGSQVLVGPRLGYLNLHRYVNSLAEMATGDWLFLWNDDALMETEGWDRLLEPFQNQMVVINPETNHVNHPRENCIFPIVPRAMVELLGHFSLSNHNDTYVETIANQLGIRRDVPIRVCHDRADLTGSNNDEVYAERQFTTGEFYGADNMANLRRDIELVAGYLEGKKRRKVGFVGLGKLGLPCALAVEHYGGHEVWGTDAVTEVLENIRQRVIPYREEGAQELLTSSFLRLGSIEDVVRECEIVFVAVQTPHDPRFEGVTPLPDDRVDFDYAYLVSAVKDVAEACLKQRKSVVLAVISTVLPGTVEREIRPHLNEYTQLCYNPFFIAMGTTIRDFMNPEFVLMGCDSPETAQTMREFYATLHEAQVVEMSIESAELTKVAYNTFIGMKIVFANTLMEICDGTGANVDDVTDALCLATNRLLSPKYMRAGMGDGGGCHPRDNIAMSFLARRLGLSYDLFEGLMRARERQTEWLASRAIALAEEHGLPIMILGKAFKPETNLTVGSPAVLLQNLLERRGFSVAAFDPYLDRAENRPSATAVYVVATQHPCFGEWDYPPGSMILDPWGYVNAPGSILRRPGRNAPTKLADPLGTSGPKSGCRSTQEPNQPRAAAGRGIRQSGCR